jgi:DNA repair protein RecO (recombination protein O)
MENWHDQGIILKMRPHGEAGAVVTLLTENHGRHAGYVHGGQSSKKRGMLEPGNLVDARWSSRAGNDQLGGFQLDMERNYAATLMQDPLQLSALLSACALCDAALPEREGHPALFHGLQGLLDSMEGEYWAAVYVMWEIALLSELGFTLDLTRCVAGGDPLTLEWVSPKSGGAVSREKGAAYADKLLPLPEFLKPIRGGGDREDIAKGLALTGYFLEHWVFVHHKSMPEERFSFSHRMRI